MRPPPAAGNDGTSRDRIWRRHAGDDWAAFDALPAAIRRRLCAHAYEAWSVNAVLLWRIMRRRYPDGPRAERAMIRALDRCEQLERRFFAAEYRARTGAVLPHEAAGATVLRGSGHAADGSRHERC